MIIGAGIGGYFGYSSYSANMFSAQIDEYKVKASSEPAMIQFSADYDELMDECNDSFLHKRFWTYDSLSKEFEELISNAHDLNGRIVVLRNTFEDLVKNTEEMTL